MRTFSFHPVIERWFSSRFDSPTEPQRLGWPAIAAGEHTLIAAPTGSGKTLAAFLAVIDRLFIESLDEQLEDTTRVVYVSPLRALSNDMHRNLEEPLNGILELAASQLPEGTPPPVLRAGLRTGDTTPSRRAAMVRRPPHILVTTPESLYLLLTARRGRESLPHVDTVIVDEIHSLVRDRRGSHLALSLERLAELSDRRVQRIGLSATQKPIDRIARFLVGENCGLASDSPGESAEEAAAERAPDNQSATRDLHSAALPTIIDVGHHRTLDLAIEVPPSPLSAVCSHEQWAEVNERIVELVREHRSTLVFVNTRRLAERVTHQLTELLDEDSVGSHHGSLSAARRLETERLLKEGRLKAVVATASLELGIDIGHVDLVIQIGSPRAIATLLQRIGRSGHNLDLVPKGRLFALSRDELIECQALLRAVGEQRLDAVEIPVAPLDVLAQQIVAEVSARDYGTDELFALVRRAMPYAELTRENFDRVVEFLAEGVTEGSGRGRVYLHHDRVGGRLRARKGARIAAVTNSGTIPDIGSFRVVTRSDETFVGTLDEDFAIESQAGDIFLLGNTSWRIHHVRGERVTVSDAGGAPPTIPFWRGEAPGRTLELSEEVSRLRADLAARIGEGETGPRRLEQTAAWLAAETCCSELAAKQTVDYVATQQAAVGIVPTQQQVLFERFFDESGGMQVVIHAPFGSRINRAWGLALRKRFCRSFDFELQATADDDGFILSLGPQHSFPLESLFGMLGPHNIRTLLEQALLAVPMFQLRWRWNVTRALLVLRRQGDRKVPLAIQRFRADDLLTAVFPRLTGCQENVVGDLEIPDHPLVAQTIEDCLHEALDFDGLMSVLEAIEAGEIELVGRDTREPSPFSYELLNANPYAFLDGGEIQERRARAVATRRSLSVEQLSDLGRLDPDAIQRVVSEAQPPVRDADELHDLLLSRVVLPVPADSPEPWTGWFEELLEAGRATRLGMPDDRTAWVAAERVPIVEALYPGCRLDPPLSAPAGVRSDYSTIDARLAAVRGFVEISGPTTAAETAAELAITGSQSNAALEALEGEGLVLRGRFRPEQASLPTTKDPPPTEFCHRRLLARIHRLTIQGLREQIQPVDISTFVRFLARHHGLLSGTQRVGTAGLYEVIGMLEGLDIPAACWERDLLAGRMIGYRPGWFDELSLAGEAGWGRLCPGTAAFDRARPIASLTRTAPVSLFLRDDLDWLTRFARAPDPGSVGDSARGVLDLLDQNGAQFAPDLQEATGMLADHLADSLGELVRRGLVSCDTLAPLRRVVGGDGSVTTHRRRGRAKRVRAHPAGGGRWSLWRREVPGEDDHESEAEAVEQWAWLLLRRWGVVFRDLLAREPASPRWWQLLAVYRRLEARGEIRGGRFIAGPAGEQYALGDTVRRLRQLRNDEPQRELLVVSAADPLNVVGTLTDHHRVPATTTNRVAFLDGRPVASLVAGRIEWFENLDPELLDTVRQHLEQPSGPHREPLAVTDAGISAPVAASTGYADRIPPRR